MEDEDSFGESDEEEEPEPRSGDAAVDQAKQHLLISFFEARSDQVFYGRQIEVLCEDQFLHWITSKALKELSREGRIRSTRVQLRKKRVSCRKRATCANTAGEAG